MTIQFNTDRTVKWDQRHEEHFHTVITEEMKRHSAHITRIEVHLSDENGAKEGGNDIRCLMEVRLAGLKPIVVTALANTEKQAILDAVKTLSATVKSTIDRMIDLKR